MAADHATALRALAALLTYPDAEVRAALPEIADALRGVRAIHAQRRRDLLALIDEIASTDPLDAEARYVDLFDRGRATSLNLFEHVHGDSRQRGPAMIELIGRYRKCGLEQVGIELPDHLPVLLEYLSCCEPAETPLLLVECAHVLRKLGNALEHRESLYAAVPAALLDLAREPGLDRDATPPPDEDIDRAWEERPAFAPPEPVPSTAPKGASGGQAR